MKTKDFWFILTSLSVIILGILLILYLIFLWPDPKKKAKTTEELRVKFNEMAMEDENKKNTSINTTDDISDDIIVIKESGPIFNVKSGITYILDKGNLQLYADIIPINENKIYVNGEAYHLENKIYDMYIKEYLYKQENGVYANTSNNIEVVLQDSSAIFYDHREDTFPFNGTLTVMGELEEPDIQLAEESEDTENEEENIEEGVTVPDKELLSFLIPEHERKEISLDAMFISNTDCNGMEFITKNGFKFYVFGGQGTFDRKQLVHLDLIYRGQNPRYNGLDFGGSNEYCFNLKSMNA